MAREKAKKKAGGKGKPAAEQDANKGLTKEQRQQRYRCCLGYFYVNIYLSDFGHHNEGIGLCDLKLNP